jgi:hypothetical protein
MLFLLLLSAVKNLNTISSSIKSLNSDTNVLIYVVVVINVSCQLSLFADLLFVYYCLSVFFIFETNPARYFLCVSHIYNVCGGVADDLCKVEFHFLANYTHTLSSCANVDNSWKD